MIDIIKSGIPGLDDMLSGGFVKNSTIFLSGPTGSGKSTFAMQFLVNGALLYAENGLYITIEESRDSLLLNFHSYDWNLGLLEEEKLLMILDYPLDEVDQFLQKNSAIKDLIEGMNIERVVVDSLLPIALSTKENLERSFILLNNIIKSWNTTTLIISEDTNMSSEIPKTRFGFESFADAWIHLSYDYSKSQIGRSIQVVKAKGLNHTLKKVPFVINKMGISVNYKTPTTRKRKKVV